MFFITCKRIIFLEKLILFKWLNVCGGIATLNQNLDTQVVTLQKYKTHILGWVKAQLNVGLNMYKQIDQLPDLDLHRTVQYNDIDISSKTIYKG